MAPRVRKRDVLDADLSFDMERLFDPYNFDHIQHGDRLGLFKQRDLPHVKHYKSAVKIFGGPLQRTRVIVAPPMETPLKHRLGIYHNKFEAPKPPHLNGPLKPPLDPINTRTSEERALIDDDEKTAKYKKWINERKNLRNNLDNLGLNESFLDRKPDKTELEKRVQAEFKRKRLWKPEPPTPKAVTPEPTPLPNVPSLTVPPPDGLQLLDKFLSLNRMRLMDFFRIADKDKSWSISREEFVNAVAGCEIGLSESEIDDIIITLDQDLDDELVYQEINSGLTQWRKNRREAKRQGIASDSPVLGQAGKHRQSTRDSIKSNSTSNLKMGSREQSFDKTNKSSRGTNKPLSREQSLTKGACLDKASRGSVKPGSCEQSQENPVTAGKSSLKPVSREQSFERFPTAEKSTKSSHLDVVTSADQPRKSSLKKTSRENTFEKDLKGMSREKSNVSLSKLSYKEVLPGSEQRQRLSDVMSSNIPSREEHSVDKSILGDDGYPTESAMQDSIYEDILLPSQETTRLSGTADRTITRGNTTRERLTAHDIGEEEELPKTSMKSQGSQRQGSAQSERSGSRPSTSNTLEPPDFDVRSEMRRPESEEEMVDIRKHDREVLSRSNMRRSLSREQKVVFDALPGVIKVGYKPIDDHCLESTLSGGVAGMVNQFRREKLKEYFEVKKLFEETGMPFTPKSLDRVLLYPGDKPHSQLRKNLTVPLGPLTCETSPFNQPAPKKKAKKRRRGVRVGGRSSGMNGHGMGRGGGESEAERSGSGGSKRSYVTVEDVYPFANSVAPKVYKENLSSGRALISRKVDNWMTFEEYSKYTENLPNRFRHLSRHSNPDAAWPGHLLDKLRLCMPDDRLDVYGRPLVNRDSVAYEGHGTGMYNGSGSSVFRHTGQSKRAYPGYNNDLNTWPIGENGVMYGNIDEHRLVK